MIRKQFIIRIAIAIAVVTGILFTLLFAFRGAILQKILDKIESGLNQRYGIKFQTGESGFSSLTSVYFSDFSIINKESEELIHIDTLNVSPSVLQMLAGRVNIRNLFLSGLRINLVCTDSICNYDSFIRSGIKAGSEIEEQSDKKASLNFSGLAERVLNNIFRLAPSKAYLRDITISHSRNGDTEQFIMPDFQSDESNISGVFNNGDSTISWNLKGEFSKSGRNFDLYLYPGSFHGKHLPLLKSMTGLSFTLDTIHASMQEAGKAGDEVRLSGHFSAENLKFYHERISSDTAVLKHFLFDYRLAIGPSYLQLDSTSTAEINQILFRAFASIHSGEGKQVHLKIDSDEIPADNFFGYLPQGVFTAVSGVQAEGTLTYKLNFEFDTNIPDSVKFESRLRARKFRITKSGEQNIYKMNDVFLHQVYEKGKLFRTIEVGPGNPYFTPLDEVSPNFKNAVLTSEDGSFFFHNGFNPEAFKQSIVANYKAGRFVRGGSTISMQLVKNVFLSRNKTIARKVEEALLVWLIESNRLCSKERMFEVYLNIIELGPGVYGIGEASEFYFMKKPKDLSLAEGIFLASLLPKPKAFRFQFGSDGQLRPHLADYYRIVSAFMLKKGLISQEEADNLKPDVEVSGPARNFIVVEEQADTLRENAESPDLH